MYEWGHNYEFSSSVDHLKSDLVELLVYNDMRTISGVLVLYYRSLGTMPILPGMS